MSIRTLFSPFRLLGSGVFLLLVTAAVLWVVPSDQYLLLPDPARPVGPLVSVKGGKEPTDGGGIYYDAIIIRRAKLFEELFPWIHDGATLVPGNQINPPGVSDRQRRTVDLREMARSQDIAAAVALEELGYKVTIRSTGALIEDVLARSPAAAAGLEPTDVIVAVNGAPVQKTTDLRRLMEEHHPGDTVRLTVRSAKNLRQARVKTAPDPHDRTRAVLGVIVNQAAQITLPIPVQIDAGSIGGPSAGLAFALDVLEELGRDVDKGYRVAATGEIGLDGSVGAIGGIKQKTIGARRAKVDIFLVPVAGDNAKEARKYAGPVRVIPVESFRQALRALATLSPKR